ncbi:MAG: hypothetical protein ACJZ8O_12640 [Pirellulaceae bacterium]
MTVEEKVEQPATTAGESPGKSALKLTLILVVATLGFVWWGNRASGIDGVKAAAIAGLLCWLGAIPALMVTSRFAGGANASSGILLGSALRTGVPLIGIGFLHFNAPDLSDANIAYYGVGLYLISLATETYVAINIIKQASETTEAN